MAKQLILLPPAALSWLVVCSLLLLVPRHGTSQDSVVESRPNVLMIAVDDLRPELGCYDIRHIISPNID